MRKGETCDAEPMELEMLTLQQRTIPRLVTFLFDNLAAEAEAEQRRITQLQLGDTVTLRNRRQVYLDLAARSNWQNHSWSFLSRRSDLATSESLYSIIAMQHFLELDIEDTRLPPERRCSADVFSGDVNDQFMLDASRSRYQVNGEAFSYADRHTEETKTDFIARLLNALRHASPPTLLQSITTVMSQSGLAALERASLCDIAVCGGNLVTTFDLVTDTSDAREAQVTLEVHRHGFSEYLAGSSGDGTAPLSCDTSSSLRKTATAVFHTSGDIDVVNFVESIDIKRDGVLLPAETFRLRVLRGPESTEQASQSSPYVWHRFRTCAWVCRHWVCCCPGGCRDIQGWSRNNSHYQ